MTNLSFSGLKYKQGFTDIIVIPNKIDNFAGRDFLVQIKFIDQG